MSKTTPISSNFPYEPNYVEVAGSKMHYIEQGTGEVFLFLHGNPTSSYLWRNIIPHLSSLGRCIAVDLIGMGKSDKPDIPYRFFDHYKYLEGFIEALELKNVTLVLHDWGSGLGFYYACQNEGNIKAIAFMEAILSPARWSDLPKQFRMGFKLMRTPVIGWFMISVMNLFVKRILPSSIMRPLTAEEMDHYSAPYPSIASRKPLRQWPCEIAIDGTPADVDEAVRTYNKWLQETELPKLLLHVKPGAILRKKLVAWAEENLKNLDSVYVGKGLHFIQEDNPDGIGEELAKWVKKHQLET